MPNRVILEEMVSSVGVDGLRELYEIFKSDATMRLDEINSRKNAIKNLGENSDDDLAILKRHAHSLKGVCRTYGLPVSGDLAFDLEQAIDSGDPQTILEAADKVLGVVPGEIEEGVALVAELTAT
ncbi:MAG: Hpt domain-containing protein [Rhodospirillaceae bacterium]|nr:Hpt domain-containing protein [Rhodospirillaceae bacterium]